MAEMAGLESWERRLWKEGCSAVAGTDEAGRGPLAGPVVSAAFAVLAQDDPEVLELLATVADSKQMKAEERDAAYEQLTHPRFAGRTAWAVAEASVAEIDESNILRASLSSMARAVQALVPRPDCVLVDGCNRPPELLKPGEQWTRGSKKDAPDEKQAKLSAFFKPKPKAEPKAADPAAPWRPARVEAVIKGDGRVPSISAASVIAKVHRDRVMERLDKEYPLYGFASHKGYGTEAHVEAIRVHGVCPQHRRSFEPVRAALEAEGGDAVGGAAAGGAAGGGAAGGAAASSPDRAPWEEAEAGAVQTPSPREAAASPASLKVARKRPAPGDTAAETTKAAAKPESDGRRPRGRPRKS